MQAKCLTLTYLIKASYASLNGGDKEADNISSIKKIQMANGLEYPYKSSQSIRRDLREQMAVLGETLSEAEAAAKETKGAAVTQGKPQQYIDDDLFGFMRADKETVKRTGPVRVSPLISLEPYRGDLDFGTNYMSVKAGGNPNIFESEIHSGFYRGTILVELDRIGVADARNYELELDVSEKKRRIQVLLQAIQNLWGVGRQSRFLSDISPKFICASLMTVKNPIFLECVQVDEGGTIKMPLIEATIADFASVIRYTVLGERKGFFLQDCDQVLSMGEAFKTMQAWLEEVYR